MSEFMLKESFTMQKTSSQTSSRAIIALILIVTGVLALMGMEQLWPLFVLVPGLIILGITFIGGRATGPFAIPGMIVTGTGALLFIQNLTDYRESWSYAWTLYGVFLGMGLVLMGQRMENNSIISLGRTFMQVGLIAFVGFAFLMEIVIGVGGGTGLFPLVLIGVGAYLVIENLPGQKSHLPWCANGVKHKKRKNKLFSGPIVYGSRHSRVDTARLRVPETNHDTD
jgi:hypothetical protein